MRASQKARPAKPTRRSDAIPEATRLRLYQLQVEIRYCEKRAYDLFLQNLVKGTSHLALGQEAVAAGELAQRVDDLRAIFRQRLGLRARAVPDCDVAAGLREAAGHLEAHAAGADPA